jgi:hypothetical protein
MPTRFAKQLTMIMRGAIAIGMPPNEALRLVLRCASDSIPPLRLAVLRDVAASPDALIDIRRRLDEPRATVDRTLQAYTLRLLTCRELQVERGDEVVMSAITVSLTASRCRFVSSYCSNTRFVRTWRTLLFVLSSNHTCTDNSDIGPGEGLSPPLPIKRAPGLNMCKRASQ